VKNYFIQTFRSTTVEFTRENSIGSDTWYLLSVVNSENKTVCRMHPDKSGAWKITGKRTPSWLQKLEDDFNYAIDKNEQLS